MRWTGACLPGTLRGEAVLLELRLELAHAPRERLVRPALAVGEPGGGGTADRNMELASGRRTSGRV